MVDPRAKITTDLQDFINLKEQLVDKEIDRVESRLNHRIKEVKDDLADDLKEVKNDLNNRINRLETDLKWFVGIALTVASVIVTVVVKFL